LSRCALAGTGLLYLLCRTLGLRRLERGGELAQTGPGFLGHQPAKSIDLHRVEIGGQSQIEEQLDHLLLVGALQCRPRRRGVELELIDGAAMREGMDPQRTVGAALDLRLADSVGDALERVGEGGTLESRRVGDHIGNRASGELGLVEWQHEVGQQNPFALPGDHLLGIADRHPPGGRQRLRLALDEGAAGLARFTGEPAAPSRP
jgi:hypothetical protein